MTINNVSGQQSDSTRLETRQIHGYRSSRESGDPVVAPIVQSTTFVQDQVGISPEHTYSRASNPTVAALEEALASVEGGGHCTAYSTGMAAISNYCLASLKAGDHVICSNVVYGGTVRLFEQVLASFEINCTFVDCTDLAALRDSVRPETRFILIETPANPTLKLVDIAAVAEIASANRIQLVVDNTFLTAALQKPFDLGADAVVYSTTKYVEGHNTSVGGALIVQDASLDEHLRFIRKSLGCIQSPFDAWLTLNGLKTLNLRVRQHSENALSIANWLARHDAVSHVYYPYLPSGEDYHLARRQQAAGGGTLAFEVHGGSDLAVSVMNGLDVCTLAENLGSTETLVTHPVSMTHGDVNKADRERLGITDGLIRLSVGLEHPEDIIADLETALRRATEEVAAYV